MIAKRTRSAATKSTSHNKSNTFAMDIVGSNVDDDNNLLSSRRRKYLILALMLKRKQLFRNKLNEEGRKRRCRNIPRNSLTPPTKSAWHTLYSSGDDGALITVTGFDHATFKHILDIFTPFFEGYTPWIGKDTADGLKFRKVRADERRGRKRLVTATSCLGLVLAWYRFRGGEFILQGWFGFTGGHTNIWLRFGRRMLLKSLIDQQDAIVKLPTAEEIAFCQEAISKRHSSLEKVYCFADGLKLPFQSCDGLTEQSMFYNGWTHGHYVTNLFVFSAKGKIIDAVINVPGSVHDSTLAVWGGTYKKLKRIFDETGGICAVDSAFAARNAPYLIRSGKDFTEANSAAEMVKMKEATSLRQAAEWEMRAIQGSMPRLKDPLEYEEKGERKRIIKLIPILYNIRLERVGLNQIANTYVPNWSRDSRYYIKK